MPQIQCRDYLQQQKITLGRNRPSYRVFFLHNKLFFVLIEISYL